jgi:hypothetical protein
MATETVGPTTWDDSPGVWFSILVNAIADHDFDRAAEAEENLRRLGVTVRFDALSGVRGRSGSKGVAHGAP